MMEYASIYWAAACLVFWAGRGVSDAKLADAIHIICDDAKLTIPQEGLLKQIVGNLLTKGESNGAQ